MRYVESLIPFEPTWKLIMKVTNWTTYVQLADFLHIKPGSVSGAKKRGNIPIDWLYKISHHYKCSMDWLLTGEGPVYTDHTALPGEPRETVNEHQQTRTPSNAIPSPEEPQGGLAPPVSSVPFQVQPVVDAVVEVLTSDHAGVKLALTQNVLMFQEMVRNAKKLDKLERRLEEVEKTRFPRETDFSTQEAIGGERMGGPKD